MKLKKYLLNGLIAVLMLSMVNCSLVSYATEVSEDTTEDTSDTAETEEENDGWISDDYERLAPSSNDSLIGLAAKYDPRDEGFFTDVKDQGETDLCWLFANLGAIEHLVSKNYGSKFDISEAHAAVAMSESINANGVEKSGYYNNPIDFAGNSGKALQYFTNWNSPIFNDQVCNWNSIVSDVSYPISKVADVGKAESDSDFSNAESLFNVTSAHYLNIREPDDVKRAIKNYGAVVTGITNVTKPREGADGELNFFSSSTTPSTGHAVMLVGWDDNYSKDNFSGDNKPTIDGAWLVKNSYYKTSYYWVSYQEGSLYSDNNYLSVVTGVQKASNNEYMLSYDYFIPEYNAYYSFRDDVYLCNVFDISDYTSTYNKISKVMMYLRVRDCSYEIKVVQLDSNGNLLSNPDSLTTLASGNYDGEGYLTAELNNPVYFTSNNKCAVFVKLSPISSYSRVYIPYEGIYKKYSNSPIIEAEINSGESYFGTFNESEEIDWNDCYDNESYGVSGHKGNLIIRPILEKTNAVSANVTISPAEITDNDSDADITIDSDVNLFAIRRLSDSYYLKQDVDYVRTNTGITLKADFINSLDDVYTELAFEFNDDITKTVIINPKSIITDVTISGSPIIGDTLTAVCLGVPEKDEYNVTYQWQCSSNGVGWFDISGATSSSYTVTNDVYNMYLRVKVTSEQFGNVVYPTEIYSDSTECKVVILGDVNSDGVVSVLDCTLLQKYLTDAAVLNNEQLLASDANRDGIVNVSDVTKIQKMLVS